MGALVGLAVVLALAPGVARADEDPRLVEARKKALAAYPPCTKTPSQEDVVTATDSHKQARKYFDRGEFDKAIQAWTNAYTFDCTRPSVFQNLANSYEVSDKAMMIALLEIYEQRDVSGPHADIDVRIADAKKAMGPPPTPVVTPNPNDKPNPIVVPQPQPDVVKARPFGAAPWAVFGVGAATLVAGIPTLVVGRIKVGQAVDQCGGHTGCTQAEQDLGNGGNTLTGVGSGLIGGGAAIAIAGLIWQLAGNAPRPVARAAPPSNPGAPASQADTPTFHFAPAMSTAFAGGFVTGTF